MTQRETGNQPQNPPAGMTLAGGANPRSCKYPVPEVLHEILAILVPCATLREISRSAGDKPPPHRLLLDPLRSASPTLSVFLIM